MSIFKQNWHNGRSKKRIRTIYFCLNVLSSHPVSIETPCVCPYSYLCTFRKCQTSKWGCNKNIFSFHAYVYVYTYIYYIYIYILRYKFSGIYMILMRGQYHWAWNYFSNHVQLCTIVFSKFYELNITSIRYGHKWENCHVCYDCQQIVFCAFVILSMETKT